MSDLYVCLSIMREGEHSGGLLASLIMADTQDEASHLAELYVSKIAVLSERRDSEETMAQARAALASIRPRAVLIIQEDEIRAVAYAVAAGYPGILDHLTTQVGTIALLSVTAESGFPPETIRLLRQKMTKHHVIASLSVDLT